MIRETNKDGIVPWGCREWEPLEGLGKEVIIKLRESRGYLIATVASSRMKKIPTDDPHGKKE